MNQINGVIEELIRHVEVSGSDAFNRNQTKTGANRGPIVSTVWVVLGEDAEDFAIMAEKWLRARQFGIDHHEPE